MRASAFSRAWAIRGNESLAAELVGAELATALGLFVPDFAIIDLKQIEVPMIDHGPMGFGPAFISRECPCITSDGSGRLLVRLKDIAELALLVMFDTWIRNMDRCPPPDYLDLEPRRDNLCFTPVGRKLKLMVIDHSHCFTEDSLEDGLHGPQFVADDRVYGLFPEFAPFLDEVVLQRAARHLASIDAASIAAIVNSVPKRWGPEQGTRNMWIERIVARRDRVPGVVMSALVRQTRMDV